MLASLALAMAFSTAKPQMWVYLATNLLVDQNVERDIALLKRAKAAGYTGFLVTDSKFTRWEQLPQRYKDNAKRFRDAARAEGVAFVACVAPIGYSNDLLAGDPDLAEGLPVKEALFSVSAAGTLVPDADNAGIKNGGFENETILGSTGWSWIDGAGVSTFLDQETVAEGKNSLRMEDPAKGSPESGNCRVSQVLHVKPFQYYHARFKVKTKELDNPANAEVKAIGKSGQSLSYRLLPIKRTMDWTSFDITFNTLDNTELNFYLGVWGGKNGTIWWDDVVIEPGGFVNLVRRPGAPLRLTSLEGGVTYVEGKDVEPISDPKTGRAQWPGDYDFWHQPPSVKILDGGKLRPGAKVKADYFHTSLIYDGQAMACMGEPKTRQLLLDQIKQVHKYLQPDGYMLSHDEIRMTGWDESCSATKKSPSELLAQNVADCISMVHTEDPGKPVYAWSDMFDPEHNAAKDGFYYLVKGQGPWYGAWKGLGKDVTVFNWNSDPGKRAKSLDFFAAGGNKQILAGYYDGPVESITGWMKDAGKVQGVQGVMYTTWGNNYADLEKFAQQVFAASSRG